MLIADLGHVAGIERPVRGNGERADGRGCSEAKRQAPGRRKACPYDATPPRTSAPSTSNAGGQIPRTLPSV